MSNHATDIRISRRFTRLYILALSAVAFLSIFGQILIQHEISNQQNDARLINLAGRQRFQSQQIVKNILILTERSPNAEARQAYLLDLKTVLATWEKYHYQLQSGNLSALGIRVKNSQEIDHMFQELTPHFSVIQNNAHQIISQLENSAEPPVGSSETSVKEILNHEMKFLRRMDSMVFQYDKEAKEKLSALRKIEFILLGLALFVLFLEGMFVFRPAVRQLRKAVIQLIDSELFAKKANAELIQVNLSLKKAEAELMSLTRLQHQQEINEQKRRTAYVIEGQEEERRRQAREIHDGLGQMLTALKLNVENISNMGDYPEKTRASIAHLQGLISQTITEARAISFNLMPAVLSDFGIASALKLLAEQSAKSTHTEIVFCSDWHQARLDNNTEIGLYRIAQEGVNNAIKYAQASEITLELSSENGHIHLHIIDNGRGFRKSKLEKASLSNGINHMKVRTHLLDGDFRMVASPGKGTRIYVKVPVKYR
ncbi:MAG: type IV pili methyl-accepting chemotaxis transducer N-terminal domain-containing protein [Bacteroidota bacterium]